MNRINMKFFILHAILFIFSFYVYAEKIPFVWHTEYNNKDTVVPVEWNEKWFGQKSFLEYNHDIARFDVHIKDFNDDAFSSKYKKAWNFIMEYDRKNEACSKYPVRL